MRSHLKKIFYLASKLLYSSYLKSYSQSGEDMVLNTIFAGFKKGIYVDVGANDPEIQSNTNFFYLKGWNGINIDANGDCIKKLKRLRKKDTNIRALVSDSIEELDYFYFESSFYNGCMLNPSEVPSKLIKTEQIRPRTLNNILSDCEIKNFEFLNIDVEGHDLQVLKSIDLNLYRPKVIIVESLSFELSGDIDSQVGLYLNERNYKPLCKTVTNMFFISQEFYEVRFARKA